MFDLARFGFDVTDPGIVHRAITRGRQDHSASVRDEAEAQNRRRDVPATRPGDPADPRCTDAVVYYVRIGNRVKIGYSTSLASRLAALNPEEVLAVEPGGRFTERRRHQQFWHLHTHGEWFRYEQELADHIAALQLPDERAAQ